MVTLRHKPPSMSSRAQAATAEMLRANAGGKRLTLDTILQHIADNPGSVAGGSGPGDYTALKRMWVCMCAQLSSQMGNARGVNIPNFGVVSLQRFANDRGNWGEKVDLVPTFTLHPTFTASFGTTCEQTKRAAHVSSVVTSPLNLAVLAMKSGMTKSRCGDMLKDIFRKVGEVAKHGAHFCVDLGVARLSFRNNHAKVQWSDHFASYLGKLTSTYNVGAVQEPDGRWGEAAIQKSITMGKEEEHAAFLDEVERRESPRVPVSPAHMVGEASPGRADDYGGSEYEGGGGGAAHVHRHAHDHGVAHQRQSNGMMNSTPYPHPAGGAAGGGHREGVARPLSAGPSRGGPQQVDFRGGAPGQRPGSAYGPRGGGGAYGASGGGGGGGGGMSNVSLDRSALIENDAKDMSQLRTQLYDAISMARHSNVDDTSPQRSNYSGAALLGSSPPARNEKFQTRLRNKRKYKRIRNKAYSDAWEEQQQQKKEQLRQERDKDRKLLEITRMREQRELQAMEQAEDSRRKQAQNVQQENKRLVEKKHRVDGKVGAQCDYWGNEEAPMHKPTLADVRQEIAEHRLRKEREKEQEAQEEALLLQRQQQLWELEQTAEKRKRKEERQAMLEEYEKSKRLRGNRKLPGSTAHQPAFACTNGAGGSYGDGDDEGACGGNYFFKGRTIQGLLEEEQAERDARRTAALKVQLENQKTVQGHESRRREERGVLATAERRNHDRAIFRALQLDSEEENGRRAQRQALRDAWDKQVRERAAARQEDRDQRMKASTLHAWRNESSDEEYDDFQSTKKHTRH